MDDPVAEVERKALEWFEVRYVYERRMRVRVQARKAFPLRPPVPFIEVITQTASQATVTQEPVDFFRTSGSVIGDKLWRVYAGGPGAGVSLPP